MQVPGMAHHIELLPDGGLVVGPKQEHFAHFSEGMRHQEHGLAAGGLGDDAIAHRVDHGRLDALRSRLATRPPSAQHQRQTAPDTMNAIVGVKMFAHKIDQGATSKQCKISERILVQGEKIILDLQPRFAKRQYRHRRKKPRDCRIGLAMRNEADRKPELIQTPHIGRSVAGCIVLPVAQAGDLREFANQDQSGTESPDPQRRCANLSDPFRAIEARAMPGNVQCGQYVVEQRQIGAPVALASDEQRLSRHLGLSQFGQNSGWHPHLPRENACDGMAKSLPLVRRRPAHFMPHSPQSQTEAMPARDTSARTQIESEILLRHHGQRAPQRRLIHLASQPLRQRGSGTRRLGGHAVGQRLAQAAGRVVQFTPQALASLRGPATHSEVCRIGMQTFDTRQHGCLPLLAQEGVL